MKNNVKALQREAERERKRMHEKRKQIVMVVLLVFLVALVIGVVVDLQNFRQDELKTGNREQISVEADIRRLLQSLQQGERYVDPSGQFSLVQPAGWIVEAPNEWTPYNVTFRGPYGVHLSILVSDVPYDDFSELRDQVEQKEIDMSIRMYVEEITYLGEPAMKRESTLHVSRVLMLDFLRGNTAHHILFSAPHEYYDQYKPVIMEWLKTYEPLGSETK